MTNAQQLKGSYVDPLALNRFLTKKKNIFPVQCLLVYGTLFIWQRWQRMSTGDLIFLHAKIYSLITLYMQLAISLLFLRCIGYIVIYVYMYVYKKTIWNQIDVKIHRKLKHLLIIQTIYRFYTLCSILTSQDEVRPPQRVYTPTHPHIHTIKASVCWDL